MRTKALLPLLFAPVLVYLVACNGSEPIANIPIVPQNKVETVFPQPEPPSADFAYSYNEAPTAKEPVFKTIYFCEVEEYDYYVQDSDLPPPLGLIASKQTENYPEPVSDITIADNTASALFQEYVMTNNSTQTTLDHIYGGIVLGKQGTEFSVPEGAFEYTDGSTVSGRVSITVEEYYNKSDFIMGGLNSVCNGQLIESSGMFNITATANGKEVRLKKGKEIKISIPRSKKPKPGTQVFNGVMHDGTVMPAGWVLPQGTIPLPSIQANKLMSKKLNKLRSRSMFSLTTDGRGKYYKGEDGKPLPAMYMFYMGESSKKKAERNLYHFAADKNNLKTYFQNKYVRYKLYNHVENMENLDTLKLLFTLDNKGRILTAKAESKTMPLEGITAFENAFSMKKKFTLATNRGIAGKYGIYLVKNDAKRNKKNGFASGQLGWVNCDRFLSENKPLVAMQINNDTKQAGDRFFCVFKNYNCVMPAAWDANGNYFFPNVIEGEDAIVIAMRGSKTAPEISITDTKVSAMFNLPDFVKTTPAEFKKKLEIAFNEVKAPAPVTAQR